MQYLSFCTWIILLNIMSFGFIYSVIKYQAFILFMAIYTDKENAVCLNINVYTYMHTKVIIIKYDHGASWSLFYYYSRLRLRNIHAILYYQK